MIPPPLMEDGAYNMNQTIINTIFPALIPLIAKANTDIVKSVIDVYTGMGGVPAPDWKKEMPPKCTLTTGDAWPPCKWYCDQQSCSPGQCHPNDVGCAKLVAALDNGTLPAITDLAIYPNHLASLAAQSSVEAALARRKAA